MTLDLKDLRWRKCENCYHLTEVAGGPDHGDFRCLNERSPLYGERIHDLGIDQNPVLQSCSVRKGTKTALITGASRGIGRAIAEDFLGQKYDLALISRHYGDVKRVAEEFSEKKYNNRIYLPFECDVSNPEQVLSTFGEIFRQFGSIDVLVNNAGVNSRRTLNPGNPEQWFGDFEANLEGWNEEIATNLTGVYVCSYVAAGYMLQGDGGSIINISSIKGKEPTSSPGYGASKAGVIKLTRDFAKALALHNIRVNCVAPGFIDTGMTAELSEEKQEAYKKMIPQGRFGSVDEVAKAVAFLASDEASYITGHTLDVNGGYLMD